MPFTPHRAANNLFSNNFAETSVEVMERIAINQAWSAYLMNEITFDDFFTFALALA